MQRLFTPPSTRVKYERIEQNGAPGFNTGLRRDAVR